MLLIAVAISLLVGYKLSSKQNERKLTVFGHELTLAQQYGLVAICSIPLFIWAGAGAAVFWVIGKRNYSAHDSSRVKILDNFNFFFLDVY